MATVAIRQVPKSGRQASHQAPENPPQHARPQSSRSAIGHANIPSASSPRKIKFAPKAKIPSAFLHWGFSCLGWLMGATATVEAFDYMPKTSRQMLWNRRCVTDRVQQEQRRIGGSGQGAGWRHPPCSHSRQGPCPAHLKLPGTSSPPAAQSKNPQSISALGIFFIWGG
jgi:hypothetical protein